MPQHDRTDDYRYSEAGQRIRAAIAAAEARGDLDAVREHEDQLNDLRLENSGVLVTEPGEPITIEHGEWTCVQTDDEDSDGFYTDGWHAKNKVTGESRIIHHSRFRFTMTPERFAWLVENDFPKNKTKWGAPANWDNADIDAAMENGS